MVMPTFCGEYTWIVGGLFKNNLWWRPFTERTRGLLVGFLKTTYDDDLSLREHVDYWKLLKNYLWWRPFTERTGGMLAALKKRLRTMMTNFRCFFVSGFFKNLLATNITTFRWAVKWINIEWLSISKAYLRLRRKLSLNPLSQNRIRLINKKDSWERKICF